MTPMQGDSAREAETASPQPGPGSDELFARLVFSQPDGEDLSKDVLRATTLIGSMAGSNVQLTSKAVAAAHCVITFDAGVLRIRDLRTQTGTKVNGSRVVVAELADGDTIQVGKFRFRLETNLAKPSAQQRALTETAGGGKAHADDTDEHSDDGLSVRELKALLTRGLITPDQQKWLTEGKLGAFSLEHYRVLEMIGAGGMGWVYAAEETDSGRRVALKVISRHQAPGIIARFRLEARAGMRLDHPNIIRTYRLGETSDVFFVAMELVKGINLQELVERQGPLPWRQVYDLASQAAEALQHAHDNQLIHRDVKPANLIIDSEGTLKVLDFGLSLINDDEDEFTLAMIAGQNCIGTPDYIAPEQTQDSFKVDARADVYSLGCTLYFALSGRVPFPGDTVREKLDAHRSGKITPLRERQPELPEETYELIDRMVALDAGERFASAAAVKSAAKGLARRFPVKFDFESVLAARGLVAKQRIRELAQKIGSQSSLTSEHVRRDPKLLRLVRKWPELSPGLQEEIVKLLDAVQE